MRDYGKIIAENKKRYAELFSYYNPITGEGSSLKRFDFFLNSKDKLYLPVPMKELPFIKKLQEYKSVEDYCRKEKGNYSIILHILNRLREKHDFEYYAFVNLKIQDKKTKKIIPFKLNKPQREYFKNIEEERIAGRAIRIDLLKTRQWGGSTVTEAVFFWIQDRHERTGWHSVLVGDVEGQAKNMMNLYKRFAKYYPKEKEIFSLSPYEGSPKNKILNERDAIISIGSMQNPDALRSSDNAMLHATEIGLWKETKGKTPEDLMQSLINSIEEDPNTFIVRESTAKGIGNYWHREWTENTEYKKVFVPWLNAEKNTAEVKDYKKLIDAMNKYDWFLWEKGATLEGIKWYKRRLASMRGDTWRMQSENPTTPTEAFQSTGNRVFPPSDVEKMKKFCYNPIAKGKLFSDAEKGNQALKNIRFKSIPEGNLWIWDFPDELKMSNRYIVVVDIGGKSDKADYSVITVLDRFYLKDGGVPQTVARCRYHIDQDVLAWEAVRIAKYYNNALLVIENNSLKRRESEEKENHFLTVLNEIEDYYDNLYTYESPDKIREGIPVKWGFHTNSSTKPMVIQALARGLRDNAFIDPDIRLFLECESYEIDKNGAYNAVSGQHDDIIMSTAIGLHVSENMDVPKLIEITGNGRATARVSLGI
jgi:hypothetical protein